MRNATKIRGFAEYICRLASTRIRPTPHGIPWPENPDCTSRIRPHGRGDKPDFDYLNLSAAGTVEKPSHRCAQSRYRAPEPRPPFACWTTNTGPRANGIPNSIRRNCRSDFAGCCSIVSSTSDSGKSSAMGQISFYSGVARRGSRVDCARHGAAFRRHVLPVLSQHRPLPLPRHETRRHDVSMPFQYA